MQQRLGLQALPRVQAIEARYKARVARRASELSPGGGLAPPAAAGAAESGQGTWRMTPGQPDRSQNTSRSYIYRIYPVGCVCIPLVQHGLLCAQVGVFISQEANPPFIVIQRAQLPPVHVQLLVSTMQTETETSGSEKTNRYSITEDVTHSAFSCDISSSLASKAVADLLFVSSRSS